MQSESSYVCDSCGEDIVIPIDLSAGESQQYVEDCPVCCHPNVVNVEVDDEGDVRVWAEAE
ncbi:MAG: CPXCG motif-containing cysteine-rich protein [Pirellulales bacterium]